MIKMDKMVLFSILVVNIQVYFRGKIPRIHLHFNTL